MPTTDPIFAAIDAVCTAEEHFRRGLADDLDVHERLKTVTAARERLHAIEPTTPEGVLALAEYFLWFQGEAKLLVALRKFLPTT
jgi:hypothetical protein